MTGRVLAIVGGIAAAITAVVVGFAAVLMFMFATIISPGAGGAGIGTCAVGAVAGGGWANPLEGQITSPYGPRNYGNGFHDGTDIAGVPDGTPFYSASSGRVKAAYGTGGPEGNGDGGHGIIVDAGGGIELWYWHAQDGTTLVHAGDTVRPGQELARMGATGDAVGAHVHFQVMVNGASVDPVPFMRARGVELGHGKSQGPLVPQPAASQAPQKTAQVLTASRTDGVSVTLQAPQMANIGRIVARGKADGVGDKGILVAVATVLQESGASMYANYGVPASLALPHDRVGSDHDSVGLFQQRPSAGWGTVAELMDVETSADRFWGVSPGSHPPGLRQVPGWEQMSVSDAAQAVQRSAFPDAYARWEPVAAKAVQQAGGAPATVCTRSGTFAAGQPLPASGTASDVRARVVSAAKDGLGKAYLWGGTSPTTGWDCSGYVQWAMTRAGIAGVPRTEQWSFGRRTEDPQPGDLVAQIPDGSAHWAHVGIYAGGGMMYSALNPTVGTILHPVDWNPGTAYFTMVGP